MVGAFAAQKRTILLRQQRKWTRNYCALSACDSKDVTSVLWINSMFLWTRTSFTEKNRYCVFIYLCDLGTISDCHVKRIGCAAAEENKMDGRRLHFFFHWNVACMRTWEFIFCLKNLILKMLFYCTFSNMNGKLSIASLKFENAIYLHRSSGRLNNYWSAWMYANERKWSDEIFGRVDFVLVLFLNWIKFVSYFCMSSGVIW